MIAARLKNSPLMENSLPISASHFPWICEGKLDMRSSCIQRVLIDVLNLFFSCVFYLFLLAWSIKNHAHTSTSVRRRDGFSVLVSACCGLTSSAYLSVGLWDLIAQTDEYHPFTWLSYLVRGLIWISLAVSLIVPKPKWIAIIATVWWVSFPLLVSALNVKVLVTEHGIQLHDVLPWPVCFLLLFSAFRSFRHFTTEHSTPVKVLSEPLLGENDVKDKSKLGQASFFSRLTFSWIDPLLRLGYSKPLNLEDIPSLNPEDEANIAYHNFAQAWDSLHGGKSSNNTNNLVLRTLTKVHLKENVFVGTLALVRTIAVVVLPLLLYAFVNYSNVKEQNLYQGFLIVGGLVLEKIVESLSQRHSFFKSRQSGMRMRSALMVASTRSNSSFPTQEEEGTQLER